MPSYIFVIYHGETKQRKYVKRYDGNWFYAEREMKFRFGKRYGWRRWSSWQLETGLVTLITTDRIMTPIGDAYRTEDILHRVYTK
jgi:hypothetical protein